jgi:hypothetical protein
VFCSDNQKFQTALSNVRHLSSVSIVVGIVHKEGLAIFSQSDPTVPPDPISK